MAKKEFIKSWIENLSMNSVAWTDPGSYYNSSTSSTITMPTSANAYMNRQGAMYYIKARQSGPRRCLLYEYLTCKLIVVIILASALFGFALANIIGTVDYRDVFNRLKMND